MSETVLSFDMIGCSKEISETWHKIKSVPLFFNVIFQCIVAFKNFNYLVQFEGFYKIVLFQHIRGEFFPYP